MQECGPACMHTGSMVCGLSWQEILGAVLAPWTFGYLMPREARSIAQFLQAVTVVVPRLGAVCVYSTFDKRLWTQGMQGRVAGQWLPCVLAASRGPVLARVGPCSGVRSRQQQVWTADG